jgi:rhodanese-related sulfurtransferase
VRGQLEWYADPSSPTAMPELVSHREARILVHCNTGARALLAAQTLKKMGYPNVTSMLGGFDDWSMLGFPIERGVR